MSETPSNIPDNEFSGSAKGLRSERRLRSWRLPALIGIFLLAVAGCVIASAIGQARDASRRAWCSCHGGGQIQLALEGYAEEHGAYPPAYVLGSDGKPAHSWRALILPSIDAKLAREYSFDEPWNGPNNSKLANRMPAMFRCPSDLDAKEGTTNYVVVVGDQTMWPGAVGRKLSATNGIDTILLVEVKDLNINWLEPRDLEFDSMNFQVNSPSGNCIGSHHPAGALVWIAGGGRPLLRDGTPQEDVRFLLTVGRDVNARRISLD